MVKVKGGNHGRFINTVKFEYYITCSNGGWVLLDREKSRQEIILIY